jgi:hypothetical protein
VRAADAGDSRRLAVAMMKVVKDQLKKVENESKRATAEHF